MVTTLGCAVYFLWDAGGTLLYVGMSNCPERRFAEHAASQPWWPDVADRTVIWLADRASAIAAERVAIAAMEPQGNGKSRRGRPGKVSIYLNKERQAAVEASGLTLLDIIDRGLATVHPLEADPPRPLTAAERKRAQAAGLNCPPHPRARVTKGFCGRCGRPVGTEKTS